MTAYVTYMGLLNDTAMIPSFGRCEEQFFEDQPTLSELMRLEEYLERRNNMHDVVILSVIPVKED